jgi:hypothetical protein
MIAPAAGIGVLLSDRPRPDLDRPGPDLYRRHDGPRRRLRVVVTNRRARPARRIFVNGNARWQRSHEQMKKTRRRRVLD